MKTKLLSMFIIILFLASSKPATASTVNITGIHSCYNGHHLQCYTVVSINCCITGLLVQVFLKYSTPKKYLTTNVLVLCKTGTILLIMFACAF